jgi:hypothetical protein
MRPVLRGALGRREGASLIMVAHGLLEVQDEY